MTQTIWKFPTVPGVESFELNLPITAKTLCVQTQHGIPTIWVLLDPDVTAEHYHARRFVVVGTGWRLGDDVLTLNYVGTYQEHGGTFVWHLFEERP